MTMTPEAWHRAENLAEMYETSECTDDAWAGYKLLPALVAEVKRLQQKYDALEEYTGEIIVQLDELYKRDEEIDRLKESMANMTAAFNAAADRAEVAERALMDRVIANGNM